MFNRGTNGLTVENFSVKTVDKDARSAVFLDDVTRVTMRDIVSNGKPATVQEK